MFNIWICNGHKITLYHCWTTGKLLLKYDDEVILYHEHNMFDYGTEHEFEKDSHKYKLIVQNTFLWFEYSLQSNNKNIMSEEHKMKKYNTKNVSFTDSTKKTSPDGLSKLSKKRAENKLKRLRKNNAKKLNDANHEVKQKVDDATDIQHKAEVHKEVPHKAEVSKEVPHKAGVDKEVQHKDKEVPHKVDDIKEVPHKVDDAKEVQHKVDVVKVQHKTNVAKKVQKESKQKDVMAHVDLDTHNKLYESVLVSKYIIPENDRIEIISTTDSETD